MSKLDLVVGVSDHDTLDSVASQAQRAESLGFARVSAGETTGRDMITTFAVIGERTDHIGLSTDVLSPYGRAPTVLAQTALTMHEATGGRFRLGVGTSSPVGSPTGGCHSCSRPMGYENGWTICDAGRS